MAVGDFHESHWALCSVFFAPQVGGKRFFISPPGSVRWGGNNYFPPGSARWGGNISDFWPNTPKFFGACGGLTVKNLIFIRFLGGDATTYSSVKFLRM